jgi:hypothetical protein
MLIAAGLYAFVASRVLGLTDRHLVYALDDAYIHMAIAKNVALHGMWGVAGDTFSASSSSPLWTLLLAAAFRVAGVRDAIPLILNSAFAAAGIATLYAILKREATDGLSLLAVLLAAVLLGPIVPLVWTGMEHTLHIFLTLLTVWSASDLVRDDTRRRLVFACGLSALMVAARYEGLFVVAGASLLLAVHRRWRGALALLLGGTLPVMAVGLWNVSHGWFFLPASILMKQTVLGGAESSLMMSLLDNVVHTTAPPVFLALLAVALLLLVIQVRSAGPSSIYPPLFIFAVAAMLHLGFAKFGYLWRYESYLMVLGPWATGVAALRELRRVESRRHVGGEVVLAVALIAILASGSRTLASNAVVATTAGHIYRQHHQLARFLGRYYDRQPVAMNDIGAVSYFTQVHVNDLMGLGTLEIATLRRAGSWDAAHINELLNRHDVKVAVIYNAWFWGDREFQRSWHRAGEWVTDAEEQPIEGTVTFLAATPEAEAGLRQALVEFNPTLPHGVTARLFEPHALNR